MEREAENNLPLGVASAVVGSAEDAAGGGGGSAGHATDSDSQRAAPAPPLYFATVQRGQDIVGCALPHASLQAGPDADAHGRDPVARGRRGRSV